MTRFEPGVWQARIGEISGALATCLEILEDRDLIVFDKETGEVWVKKWFSFHKFSSAAGRAAFDRGMKDLQSVKIRGLITDAARYAGVLVDKNQKSIKNQRQSLPTPTSTSTTPLDELLQAAVWEAEKDGKTRGAGWIQKVKNRMKAEGVSESDLETRQRWQRASKNQASAARPEPLMDAEIIKRGVENYLNRPPLIPIARCTPAASPGLE